nr:unnamed protein product [Callosobruchus analis]
MDTRTEKHYRSFLQKAHQREKTTRKSEVVQMIQRYPEVFPK